MKSPLAYVRGNKGMLFTGVAILIGVAIYEAWSKRAATAKNILPAPTASGVGDLSKWISTSIDQLQPHAFDLNSGGTTGTRGVVPTPLANVNNGFGYDAIPLGQYGYFSNEGDVIKTSTPTGDTTSYGSDIGLTTMFG